MNQFELNGYLPDGTPHTLYKAHAKGALFHENATTNLLAVGNRGGGKSLILRMDAHMRALSVPNCNLILIRKTLKQLHQSHFINIQQEMKMLGGYFHATNYIAYYPNNSKLFFSYVGHDTDSMNLLSAEFLALYADEISVIPWEYFLKLAASVRSMGPMRDAGHKAVVRAATNPLGESASEVNKYFVTKAVDPEEDADYLPDEWDSIRIDMQDNPYADVAEYKKRFSGLADHIKRAWLDGEFMDDAGLFDFRPNKDGKPWHVIPELPELNGHLIAEHSF